MSNDSATGGYLAPANEPAPLQGQSFEDFLHDVIEGITGVDSNLIRPRWQPEPPNIPPAAELWIAFGIGDRNTQNYPYVAHEGEGDGSEDLQTHEEFELKVSVYDLGAGASADEMAARLRDGVQIPQNLSVLQQAGMGYVGCSRISPAPVLFKERWLYRADLTILLRRLIRRTYPVLNVESMVGTLTPDGLWPVDISVDQESTP